MSGQMIDRRICCLALSLLIASCSAAYGQVAPASATVVLPTQSSSIEQLVIGDRYEVAVQRGEAKEQYHGTLVKVTDRWLVLLNKYETRTERGVPVAAKVPYLNRLFRNVGIGRSMAYRWIPREAATIRGRTIAEKNELLPTPKSDFPTAEEQVTVRLRNDQGVVGEDEWWVSFHDDQITCHYLEFETVVKRTPVLGNLPLVGGAFTQEKAVAHEKNREFPLSDVLSIVDSSAMQDSEEPQPAP